MTYQRIEKEAWQEHLRQVLRALENLTEEISFRDPAQMLPQLKKANEEYLRLNRTFQAARWSHKQAVVRFNRCLASTRELTMQLKYGKVLLAKPEDMKALMLMLKRLKVKARVRKHRMKKQSQETPHMLPKVD